ncbi:MAG: VCBS domain-containing protein, partial [Alphaproteobacteria bacterium]|nr:VCBS domain-containing protein [Alphaproteobacteria bacterium]
DAFDLTLATLNKGNYSTASIEDHAAEVLFFLRETRTASALVEDSVPADANLSTEGAVAFLDVGLIQSATIALKSSTSNPQLPGFIDNSGLGTVAIGEILFGLNNSWAVGWSFTIPDSDPVLQSLAMGQTLTQTYTITIDNGQTQDVVVTLIGTNDAPTIVSSSNNAVLLTEDTVGDETDHTAIGNIIFRDVDLIDSHQATVVLKSSTSNAQLPGFINNVSQIGTFSLTSGVSEMTTDTGQVSWSFTVADDDPVLQSLANGQTLMQVYTITITDNNGAVATQDVTVTLAGTNDPIIITGEDLVGAVTAQDTLTDSGLILFTDIDLIDVHVVSATGAPIGSVLGTLTVVQNSDTTGTGSGGQLTWTYSVASSAIAYLDAGQTKVESFTVTLTDQNGSVITRQIDVTINGSNDVPVIGGVHVGSVAEDVSVSGSFISTSGLLTIVDADLGQSNFTAIAGIAGSNGYGTFTLGADGSWTYTASNNQTAIQQLGAGQSLTDSFTAVSSDGTASQLVTVTINGSNDVAWITGGAIGSVAEDGTLTAGGTLTVADPDGGEDHFQTPASLAGIYGAFTFDPNTGVWGYTLNNEAAQALGAGQVVHDTLTVTSADGSASQQIDVTITGSNDAPVVQGGTHRVPNITQNSGQLVFDGEYFFGDDELTVTDLDGPLVGIAVIGFDNANGVWQYQLSGTGEWTNISLSSGEALLLSANDRVRYNGDASQTVEALTFKAWDGSDGSTSGDIILISDVWDSSAFSDGTYTVITKNSNDAPEGVAGELTNLSLTEP